MRNGTQGTCVGYYPVGCGCMWTCAGDGDCRPGEACECNRYYSECVPAECRSDADCPGGETCDFGIGERECGGDGYGYHCHTPRDDCRSGNDCGSDPNVGALLCTYSARESRWICSGNESGCQ